MDETKKHYIPFDFYDFFGYIFPGFLMFSYIVTLMYVSFPHKIDEVSKIIKSYENDVIYIIIFSICLIIMIYFIGHFVATIGSFLLERVFNLGIFDLPINYLLKLEHTVRYHLIATYKYIFFTVNIILVLTIFAEKIIVRNIIMSLLLLLSVLIVIRLVVEILNSFEKSRYWIHDLTKHKYFSLYLYFPNKIFSPFINFLRLLVNNNKQFSNDFILRYSVIFRNKFNLDYKYCGEENLWLPLYSISIDSSMHFSVIRTWHHLSGFSRNISCASFISAFIIVYLLLFVDDVNIEYLRYVLYFSLAFAWIFFLRYLNLSQSYFVKNVIRSFVAENSKEK